MEKELKRNNPMRLEKKNKSFFYLLHIFQIYLFNKLNLYFINYLIFIFCMTYNKLINNNHNFYSEIHQQIHEYITILLLISVSTKWSWSIKLLQVMNFCYGLQYKNKSTLNYEMTGKICPTVFFIISIAGSSRLQPIMYFEYSNIFKKIKQNGNQFIFIL